VDLFDVFSFVPPPSLGSRSRDRSPDETVSAGVVAFVLPAIDVCVLLFAHLGRHATPCLVVLPLAFAALGVPVCRRLGVGWAYTTQLALTCAGLCFFWGLCAVFLTAFTWAF
jgi:hypothetical protein